VSHRIDFSPEALGDLIDLYDYIAARDGANAQLAISTASRNAAAAFQCFQTVASGATIYAPAYAFSTEAETLRLLSPDFRAPVPISHFPMRDKRGVWENWPVWRDVNKDGIARGF
jgi:hypothetical protein